MAEKSSRRQDTAYNRLRRVEARMDDVFSTARQFMRPHESILVELKRQVYDTPDFKKLRGIDQSYLSGKSKALMDAHYRYELEWRVSLEGRLMPGSEVPEGRWSDVEAEAGRHVYRRDPTRHFAGVAAKRTAVLSYLPEIVDVRSILTRNPDWDSNVMQAIHDRVASSRSRDRRVLAIKRIVTDRSGRYSQGDAFEEIQQIAFHWEP